jgi:glycosyltransferase involved in cell wall biosynthesis
MHIALVVWGMFTGGGGLERAGSQLANAMRVRGHSVTIFHFGGPEGGRPAYPVDPSVSFLPLQLGSEREIALTRSRIAASEPHVLCGLFSHSPLMFFPCLLNGAGIPFIVSEHSNPRIIETERWNAHEHRACLHAADAIHVLSACYREMLPKFLQERCVVIPNACPPPLAPDWERETRRTKILLAAGRFVDSIKRFSLLIRAFARLAPAFPEWKLMLCGDGPDAAALQALAAELCIADAVSFPGHIGDMDGMYAQSNLFCLPSRYEGFPLVLTEAQRHALPVAGFAGCSGVNEIVVHGENGLLAEGDSHISLAATLRVLMADESLRRSMGLRGRELLSRYAESSVYDAWEELFAKTATLRGRTRLCFPSATEEARASNALQEILWRDSPFTRPLDVEYGRLLERYLQSTSRTDRE